MVDYLCVAAKRNEKFIDLSVGICVIEYNWEVWRFIC
jgi:beta-galactosidase beta subunit